jgi:large subunit ribosomal protein L4e
MSARPTVSVFKHTNAKEVASEIKLPHVFTAPLRHDIVTFVHDNVSKNTRQAHGINFFSGMKTASLSWGTGRAVARIPRMRGSGTSRSGQGANGNMCRAGRMAHPLRTWRRWHRKVNLKQRRHALAAAIAATAVVPLVVARGHRVMGVPQLPLIFSDDINNISKAKEAIKVFKDFKIAEDILRVKNARKIRAGKGKMRNRRFKNRRGPLVIGDDKSAGLKRAVRNIPGVDFLNVNRLNIRHLAPGGHLGRFCVWTESAVKRLNDMYGSANAAAKLKSGYRLNQTILKNPDITQLINSNEIQSVLKARQQKPRRTKTNKKNPLKNKKLHIRLNPYAAVTAAARTTRPAVSKKLDKKKAKGLRVQQRKAFNSLKAKVDGTAEANIKEYNELISVTRF